MGFFDKIKDSVSLAGAGVSQKVSYTADTMKLNNQIRSNDKEIEKLIYQVGLKCVELYLEKETTEYEELFAQIRRLRTENDKLREEIHRLGVELEEQEQQRVQEMQEKQAQREQERKERRELERRQENIVLEAEYAEVKEEEEKKTGEEGVKVCPHCGKQNDLDAVFCIYCGRPYAEEMPDAEKPETDAPDIAVTEIETPDTKAPSEE